MTVQEQAAILSKAFKAKGAELETALDVAMEMASLFVEGAAKKLAPVDTGLLRTSINHRITKKAGKVNGDIGTTVEYAPFVEFPTSRTEAQPFLTPALNDNKATIQKIITDKLKGPLK